MIRLFRSMVESAVVALLHLHYVNRVSMYQAWGNLLSMAERGEIPREERARVNDALGRISHSLMDEADGPLEQALEMSEVLHTQLSSKNDEYIIDRIVKILNLPFRNMVLDQRTLDSLSKAILLPDELGGLKERLASKESSCGSCNRTLVSGELGVFMANEDGIRMYCFSCMTPRHRKCSLCDNVVPNSGELIKLLREHADCGCSKKNKVVPKEGEGVVNPTLDDLDHFNRQYQQMREMARQAGAGRRAAAEQAEQPRRARPLTLETMTWGRAVRPEEVVQFYGGGPLPTGPEVVMQPVVEEITDTDTGWLDEEQDDGPNF